MSLQAEVETVVDQRRLWSDGPVSVRKPLVAQCAIAVVLSFTLVALAACSAGGNSEQVAVSLAQSANSTVETDATITTTAERALVDPTTAVEPEDETLYVTGSTEAPLAQPTTDLNSSTASTASPPASLDTTLATVPVSTTAGSVPTITEPSSVEPKTTQTTASTKPTTALTTTSTKPTTAPVTVAETTTTATETTVRATVGPGVHADIVKVINVAGRNPGGNSWKDSYSVGNRCYCATTFDHNIGGIEVTTPDGKRTVREVCDKIGDGPGATGRPIYNDIQCGNGPANNAGDEDDCPGRVDIGRQGCGHIGPTWDLSVFR